MASNVGFLCKSGENCRVIICRGKIRVSAAIFLL